MSSHGHDVERAYVAAMLDSQRDRFNREIESMRADLRADLERLRESWSSGYADQLADDGGPQSAPKPARQEPQQDVSLGEPASPGPVPAGRPDPRAAELERARAIRDMPMSEYAARRAELGVQSPTSMNRLFG
jgi:hypothetical protein